MKDRRTIPVQWNVILRNDDVNQIEYVINKLTQILHFSKEEAINKVDEINSTGESIVATCHLELAELYFEQLSSARLIVLLQKSIV